MRGASRAKDQLSFDFGREAPARGALDEKPAATRPVRRERQRPPGAPSVDVGLPLEPAGPIEVEPAGPLRRWTLRARPGVLVDVRAAQRLAAALGREMSTPIRVVLTDNRRTMISVGRRGGRVEIRLHQMFLDADEDTIRVIARYVETRGRSESGAIDRFVKARRGQIRAAVAREENLKVEGESHHLGELFEAILERYFEPLSGEDYRATFGDAVIDDVRLTWGNVRRRRRGQRSIQLGTYVTSKQLIRIHPVLDQAWVPSFYVSAVLFHELLHHLIPPESQGGRMIYHSTRFRRAEAAYEHHAAAEVWERENLARLLRSLPK